MTRPDPVLEKWLQEQERKLIRAQTDLVRFQQQPRRGSAGEALLFNMMADGWRFGACGECDYPPSQFKVTLPDFSYGNSAGTIYNLHSSATAGASALTISPNSISTPSGGWSGKTIAIYDGTNSGNDLEIVTVNTVTINGDGTATISLLDTTARSHAVGKLVLLTEIPNLEAGEYTLSKIDWSTDPIPSMGGDDSFIAFDTNCVWGGVFGLDSFPCTFIDGEESGSKMLLYLHHGNQLFVPTFEASYVSETRYGWHLRCIIQNSDGDNALDWVASWIEKSVVRYSDSPPDEFTGGNPFRCDETTEFRYIARVDESYTPGSLINSYYTTLPREEYSCVSSWRFFGRNITVEPIP